MGLKDGMKGLKLEVVNMVIQDPSSYFCVFLDTKHDTSGTGVLSGNNKIPQESCCVKMEASSYFEMFSFILELKSEWKQILDCLKVEIS